MPREKFFLLFTFYFCIFYSSMKDMKRIPSHDVLRGGHHLSFRFGLPSSILLQLGSDGYLIKFTIFRTKVGFYITSLTIILYIHRSN